MAKRIRNSGSPVGGATRVSRATFLKTGRELQAMGFRIQESKGFPPLDMNAHSSNSDHYAFGGYGAFDGNAVAGGVNNTWLEKCLIDTVMVPHLKKRGFRAILWQPRKGIVGGHTTWCHAGRSTWGDCNQIGGWSRDQLKQRDAWLRKHGNGKVAVSGKRGPQQNLDLGSAKANKRLQKVIGTKADGDVGPNTIGALQRVFIEGKDKRSNISTTAWKIGKKHGVVLDYSASAPKSSIIASVQEYLNTVYSKSDLKVDGMAGPAFKKTLNAYLADGGAFGHGSVKPKLPTVLKYGDTGAAVKTLQKALGIPADGSFGPSTREAVKKFQKSKGLSVDGMVGPKTQSALF